VTATKSWPSSYVVGMGAEVDYQVAAPAELRTPNLQPSEESLNKECGWKDGDRGGPAQTAKTPGKKKKNRLDTNPAFSWKDLADGKSLIALEACSGPKFVMSRAGEAYAA